MHKEKLNIKKPMSFVTQTNTKDLKLKTISEQKDAARSKPLNHSSHVPEKRTTLQNSKAKIAKRMQSPTNKVQKLFQGKAGKGFTESPLNHRSVTSRKSIKKKNSRRKKLSDTAVHEIAGKPTADLFTWHLIILKRLATPGPRVERKE